MCFRTRGEIFLQVPSLLKDPTPSGSEVEVEASDFPDPWNDPTSRYTP